MKANRTPRQLFNDEEAVSPVIGVILMVAITVVLAAVVFVLVSDLGGDSEAAPNITFKKDETNDRITVVRADPEATWSRIALQVDTTQVIQYDINLDSASVGTHVAADGATAADGVGGVAAGAAIGAGDYIDLCHDSAVQNNVQVSILDLSANAVLGEFTFSTIGFDTDCV